MYYLLKPIQGNEFKICDEITDEVIAIFFDEKRAIEYLNSITKKEQIF